MANDDETLTFRLRAVAENMGAFSKAARGAEDVNSAMIKSRKTAEALATTNRKLTAARDKEADAAGRVRTAETRLNEIMKKGVQNRSQIVAAEERLATARRNSSRATNDANRIEQDFKRLAEKAIAKTAEQAGADAGHRFHVGFRKSMRNRSMDDEIENGSRIIGSTFGSGVLAGLQAALRSEAGPAIAAGLMAVVAIAAPAIGAVLAGGIVTAFGAGIGALAIVFAAKSEAVKAKWRTTMSAMGDDMRLFAKPFESVLIHMAGTMRTTFSRLAPALKQAFGLSAGPIQKFADQAIQALERFKPAIIPITNAFNTLLVSLGPALQDAIGSIADGLIVLSDSVSRNPTGLPDFIRGVGDLTQELLIMIAHLNDASGAFERLTGGTSLVTVTMKALQWAVGVVLGPLILLARYVEVVSNVVNALKHNTDVSGKSMSDAAKNTGALAGKLAETGTEATKTGPKVKTLAEKTADAAKKASDAAKAFEDWIDQMFRFQNLALTMSGAQISFRQAVDAANASIKENGRTLNINTKAGQSNQLALNAVAAAAQKQTESYARSAKASGELTDGMIKAGQGTVQMNRDATASHKIYVKLAMQMGKTRPQAEAMANAMIKIPNVSREAKLTANKKDLDRKLATAKRQLAEGSLTKERRAKLTADIRDHVAKLKQVNQALRNPKLTKEYRAKLTAEKHVLDRKLAEARRQLANPQLTKERKATLNANITKLTAQIRKAQAQINGLKGRVITVRYSAEGVTTWTAASTRGGGKIGVATGGKIVGRGTGTDDRAGMFALSNREWVIKAKSSQKYGDYAMGSVNDGTAQIIPGMASGGRPDLRFIKQGVFKSVAQGEQYVNRVLGGPALSWARSQVGKPYLWGGVGPSGYDCSGFMSAIVNVIRGQNPYHRLFATGSLPGGLFAKGSGRFNIGWFKGNPGHTAGTLNGVNVESRGGRGVVVGSGARGAGDGLFNSGIWHLKGYAKGGKVSKVRGDPPYDGYYKWLEGLKSYARGTPYVPRDGLAYLHRGERVTSASRNLGSGEVVTVRLHPADIRALARAYAAGMGQAKLQIETNGGRVYGLLTTNG